MEKQENSGGNNKHSGFFSKRLKAGKRRTYFFDVKSTRQGDFFLTITESKKNFDAEGYESHKIFLYKEDFKKFIEGLNEAVNYVKTDLLPEYDFEAERPERTSTNNNNNGNRDHSNHTDNHRDHDGAKHDGVSTHKVRERETAMEETSQVVDSTISPNTSAINPTVAPPINDDEQIDWN